jgi:hypothetical protein
MLMAHELAHLTMQRINLLDYPPLRGNAAYQGQMAVVLEAAKAAEVAKHEGEPETRWLAEQERLFRLADAILNEKDVVPSWAEQEADHAGFEFFIRAGFDPDWFTRRFYQWMPDNTARSSCRDIIAALNRGEAVPVPERGASDHPAYCRRVWEIDIAEQTKHAAEIAALIANGTVTNVFPGDLKRIAQERPSPIE